MRPCQSIGAFFNQSNGFHDFSREVAAQQLCPRLAYLNDCDGSPGEPRSFDCREALGFLFWNSECFKRLLNVESWVGPMVDW